MGSFCSLGIQGIAGGRREKTKTVARGRKRKGTWFGGGRPRYRQNRPNEWFNKCSQQAQGSAPPSPESACGTAQKVPCQQLRPSWP